MTLKEFRGDLLTVTKAVYHLEAEDGAEMPYIVWQEVKGRALHASGKRQEVIRRIQVDLFTLDEFEPLLDLLLEKLEQGDVAFTEPETIYDTDAKSIRHIVECEVV